MKTEEKKLRHLPKVPVLMDELSLEPEVRLITTPDCLLETHPLPGTYKPSGQMLPIHYSVFRTHKGV